MQTRKYPRTLEEAFGPYERGTVYDHDSSPKFDWQDVVVMAGCAVAFVGWIAVMVLV